MRRSPFPVTIVDGIGNLHYLLVYIMRNNIHLCDCLLFNSSPFIGFVRNYGRPWYGGLLDISPTVQRDDQMAHRLCHAFETAISFQSLSNLSLGATISASLFIRSIAKITLLQPPFPVLVLPLSVAKRKMRRCCKACSFCM